MRKLDQELAKFKMELEADNAGITEILERRKYNLWFSIYLRELPVSFTKETFSHRNLSNYACPLADGGIWVSEPEVYES